MKISRFFLISLLLSAVFWSCKPQERIVEVEKWSHDTTTVTDTVHVKDIVIQHDSIFKTEYITQFVKDSTQTDVSWKHYTYDDKGNVTSMTDYTSSTHHGTEANTATESASTSVGNQSAAHEETGSHSASSSHTEKDKEKEYIKTGLSKWQQFVQVLGYTMLTLIGLGVAFGVMRLYGKRKKL